MSIEAEAGKQDWVEHEPDGPIRVAVVGAGGRMGQEVLRALTPQMGFEVVAAVDNSAAGSRVRDLVGPKGPDLVVEDKLGAALERTQPAVLVDFTHHAAAYTNASSAIKRGINPVIGTTGLSKENLKEIRAECAERKLGGLYAPNFAIGAVLMMRFAELAAKWLPDVEVIELHHDKKEDAPSGTAMLTAERIAEARTASPSRKPRPVIKAEGARGATVQTIPVHSVRLPGLVAHQMVLFGGQGELLTLRHDSFDRVSFMEGVKLAVRRVRKLDSFVVGLEHLLT